MWFFWKTTLYGLLGPFLSYVYYFLWSLIMISVLPNVTFDEITNPKPYFLVAFVMFKSCSLGRRVAVNKNIPVFISGWVKLHLRVEFCRLQLHNLIEKVSEVTFPLTDWHFCCFSTEALVYKENIPVRTTEMLSLQAGGDVLFIWKILIYFLYVISSCLFCRLIVTYLWNQQRIVDFSLICGFRGKINLPVVWDVDLHLKSQQGSHQMCSGFTFSIKMLRLNVADLKLFKSDLLFLFHSTFTHFPNLNHGTLSFNFL